MNFTHSNNFQSLIWSILKPFVLGLVLGVVVLLVSANPALLVLGLSVGIISAVVLIFVYDAYKK